MGRGLLLAVALFAAFGRLSHGQGASQIGQAISRAAGVPYPKVAPFYVPLACAYVIDYFGQCGIDQGACCPLGYSCQGGLCAPETPTYTGASANDTLLVANEQCGYTGGTFGVCPDGYSCIYSSFDYASCLANPAAVPPAESSVLLNAVKTFGIDTSGTTIPAGVQTFNFELPAAFGFPAKPVSISVNSTRAAELIQGVINSKSPPPPVTPTPPGVPASPPPPPTPVTPTPAPAPAPVSPFTTPNINFKPPPPVKVSGNEIVNSITGAPVKFNGFNWFGFNVGQTMVDGLYQNYANPRNFTQVGDFSTIVYRQQALGFNAVRLPFRFGDLNIAPPKDFRRPCSIDTPAQIKGNLSNPTLPYGGIIDYNAHTFPAQTAPVLPPLDVATTGICNSYLPMDTTLNRFLWVIQFYVGNGFYVAIDYHAVNNPEDQATVADPATFRANWQGLLAAIQSLPTWQNGILPGRVFLDLLNEPDTFNMTWDDPNINTNAPAGAQTVPAWSDLYLDTSAALLAQETNITLFVEGTGQKFQPGTAYGMGFGSDPSVYSRTTYGFFTAGNFFRRLGDNTTVKPHTVVTPHVYGDQVTGWTQGTGNTNAGTPTLPNTYFLNWAYLNQVGYPNSAGTNLTYPIIIGEFGNVFNSSYNSTLDDFSDTFTDQWIHDFAEFSNNLDPAIAARYPHRNITSTFWWDWNSNSFPQLGLVNADPGVVPDTYTGPLQPGWLAIQWIKINNLTAQFVNNPYVTPAQAVASGGGWGLLPWYLS